MRFDVLDVPVWGLFELPVWGYLLIVLGVTHISIASITIFLHRIKPIGHWSCTRLSATSFVFGFGSLPGPSLKNG